MQMPVDRWRDCACGAARNAAVSADPWQHLSRPLSGRAQSVGPTAQVCLGFLAAEWLNRERERKQRWGERRSPRVGCSAAQPSSTSARLHWLSMEREQGDGDTSPGRPLSDGLHCWEQIHGEWLQVLAFMCFSSCEGVQWILDFHLFIYLSPRLH